MNKSQYWQATIQQWRDSDLTQKQFCAEQNIKLCTFHYWLKKQRLDNEPNPAAGFIPVAVTSSSNPEVELHLGQAVLKLNLALLPDVLNQLKQTGWLHATA